VAAARASLPLGAVHRTLPNVHRGHLSGEIRKPASPSVRSSPSLPDILGQGTPRGYGTRPKLSPEAAAAFATYVDSARARAAIEGRTLVYTVRWN
jgi:hypothetical protein